MRKVVPFFSYCRRLWLLPLIIWGLFAARPLPLTEVALGEALFFDPILSADYTVSCASCHKPEFAFADSARFSRGVAGKVGVRNTPSVMNMSAREHFFWDGRAASLEAQVVGPVENPMEMNLPFSQVVNRLRNNLQYRSRFLLVYGVLPDSTHLVRAIAAYERTLETDQTPNDRWLNDEAEGLSEAQIRGRDLFMSKRSRCFDCHFTPDFTADEFRNIGLFDGKALNDSGRFLVSRKPEDIGKFKTPGLRNVALTAPYMHNGQFRTLREVIDYYDEPGKFHPHAINRDTILPKKIGMSEREKQDLEAFLHALTDDRFRMGDEK